MKIAFCLSSLPGYSETFIRSTLDGLSRDGHDVRVFIFNRSRAAENFVYVNPFPLVMPRVLFLFPLVLARLLIKRPVASFTYWKSEKADGKKTWSIIKSLYINAHIFLAQKPDWLHYSFATLGIHRENLAKALGIKLAVSLRGFDIGIYPLRHPGCYHLLWRKVDKIHTISDDLYRLALKEGLAQTTPVQKIRPAIQTEKLIRKKDPGVIKSPCRILSVGRLEWKKGFEYALLAMKKLNERGVDFSYRIVGAGGLEDQLKFAILELGLSEKVTLLGKISHDEVFQQMHDADLYLQPSIQEGFCNSLLEAQGTGLLCIASDAEGLTENVLHDETGWIVHRRNYNALAETIERIIEMPLARRKTIAERAMQRVKEEFAIARLVREFGEFYH